MIERIEGGLRVTAPMVIANATALLQAGRELLHGNMVLDLAAVSEADSSALSLIFAWLRDAHKRRATLRIVHPPASLLSLAALYGVSELLPLA